MMALRMSLMAAGVLMWAWSATGAEMPGWQRALTKVMPETYVASDQKVIGRYEHSHFDAVVYSPSGQIDLFIKEDGKYLSYPLRVFLTVWYHDPEEETWPPRKPTEFTEDPVYEKDSVVFKQHREDGVYSETYFEFADNTIRIGYKVKDPSGIEIPSNHRLQINVPPVFKENSDHEDDDLRYSPRFPEGLTPEQAAKEVASFYLKVDVKDDKSVRYPYDKGIDKIAYPLSGAEIGGGAYGLRTANFKISKKAGLMQAYLYSGYAPMTGYSLSYTKEKGSSSATMRSRQMSISIE